MCIHILCNIITGITSFISRGDRTKHKERRIINKHHTHRINISVQTYLCTKHPMHCKTKIKNKNLGCLSRSEVKIIIIIIILYLYYIGQGVHNPQTYHDYKFFFFFLVTCLWTRTNYTFDSTQRPMRNSFNDKIVFYNIIFHRNVTFAVNYGQCMHGGDDCSFLACVHTMKSIRSSTSGGTPGAPLLMRVPPTIICETTSSKMAAVVDVIPRKLLPFFST